MKTVPSDIKQLKDKTFIINLVLTQKQLASARQKALVKFQSTYQDKGFRQGKVPLSIVESNTSPEKIIEEVITDLVSDLYSQKIKQYDLRPIIEPRLKVLNPPLTFDKDWQLELTGCQLPEVKLDPKYLDGIKKINQTVKEDDKRLDAIISSLASHAQADIPQILIEADLERKLTQLVDQTRDAGLTVAQYLKSRKQDLDQYKADLSEQIKKEWLINLCIDHIARTDNLKATQAEIDHLISANPKLSQNPNLIHYLLTQQKVLDHLKSIL